MTTIEILEATESRDRQLVKVLLGKGEAKVAEYFKARADAVHEAIVTMQMPLNIEMSDLRARYQRTISAFREDLRAIDEIVKRVSFDIDGGD
jgi:hypothetical protein